MNKDNQPHAPYSGDESQQCLAKYRKNETKRLILDFERQGNERTVELLKEYKRYTGYLQKVNSELKARLEKISEIGVGRYAHEDGLRNYWREKQRNHRLKARMAKLQQITEG